jgi:predicted DNA-binding transcriptional regulator
MNKDQVLGAVILIGSIVGIGVYAYLLFLWSILVLELTAFLAVAAVLVILAWIGYTLATTPPPMPLEDFKLEEETKTEEPKKE